MSFIDKGYNGASVDCIITLLGSDKIVGIEDVSGFGVEQELEKVRGSGGGFHRGYAGEGFLNATPGTITLWISTLQKLINIAGGVRQLTNARFDINFSVVDRTEQNPPIKVNIKNCAIMNIPLNLAIATAENIVVELEVDATEFEIAPTN